MHRPRPIKWSIIALHVPAVRPPCAVPNCFSVVTFGSPCLGQAWKKASSGSGRLSQQRSAHSTRNTQQASVRPARRSSLEPSADTRDNQELILLAKLSELFCCSNTGRAGRVLSRPLQNSDANYRQREQRMGQW